MHICIYTYIHIYIYPYIHIYIYLFKISVRVVGALGALEGPVTKLGSQKLQKLKGSAHNHVLITKASNIEPFCSQSRSKSIQNKSSVTQTRSKSVQNGSSVTQNSVQQASVLLTPCILCTGSV